MIRVFPSLCVIGTDTAVGKTFVAARLVKKYQKAGVSCIPFKPVATGSCKIDGQETWADTAFLARASKCDEAEISLYKFNRPLSPHLAASLENAEVDLEKIVDKFKQLNNQYEAVIVEGTGGIMVPLNDKQTYLDLVSLLNIPVIIVTHPNLGTINHSLLTVNALRERDIEVQGLVINRFPAKPDEAQSNNPRELEKLTGLKILETIPEIHNHPSTCPARSDIAIGGSHFLEKVATSRNFQQAIEADRKYVWHPFTPMQEYLAEEPASPMIVEAEDCYLIDSNGNKYLDGASSLWVNVHGHRIKELDKAINAQLEKVAHSTLLGLSNEPSALLAEKLVQMTPNGLSKVFYSDSGSTAVEIALKVAFQYFKQTGRAQKKEFVSLCNAYHGDTIGSVSIGGMDLFHSIFKELLFNSHQFPNGDLDKLETLLKERKNKIAAVIMEPLVQGAAGIFVQPAGNLKRIEQLCRSNEVLLIVDEVATGFGRTGKMFACDHENVRPDIMCLAKGITGGYLPLAATLFTEEIYSAFLDSPEKNKTFFHGHTYTGNPLACAVALKNIELLDNNFMAALEEKTAYLSRLLQPLGNLKHVGDIRQCGLMAGIELMADNKAKKSFSASQRIGRKVILKAREKGLIIRPLGDVIVIMPPLAIKPEQLAELVNITKWAIEYVTSRIN